jgi:hypothetical protein
MAKLKVDIVSHFGTTEDVESDGYKVGTLRLGVAKIRRGDRVVAELKVGIQIPTDNDETYKLAIILSPTGDELGFDADKSLELDGPVATALVELLVIASPYLKGESDVGSSGRWA